MLSQNLSATLYFQCCLVKRSLRKVFPSQERFLEESEKLPFSHFPAHSQGAGSSTFPLATAQQPCRNNSNFWPGKDIPTTPFSLFCVISQLELKMASDALWPVTPPRVVCVLQSGNWTAAALGLCPFCPPYLSFCHLLIFHFYDILFW